MSCPTCEQIICVGQDDTRLYSLEGPIYPFVLNCPPGYDCNGSDDFFMECCGQVLSVSFPPGSSADEKVLLIDDIVKQCANRLAFCGELDSGDPPTDPKDPDNPDDPPPPYDLYYNIEKSCKYICPDGSYFTFTVPAGTFAAPSQSLADSQAQNYACQMAKARLLCLYSNIPSEFCVNSAFSYTITASGTTVSSIGNSWQITSGSLPNGLTISGTGPTATVSGTPTTGGSFTFTVQITTPTGEQKSKSFTICIIEISPATPLTSGIVGTAYSKTFTTASCAIAPLSWQVSSGSLPTGLSLNESTGVLSGIPTVAGTYNFQIHLQTAST